MFERSRYTIDPIDPENEAALAQLRLALDHDREECWPLYEEVGRVVTRHLGATDAATLTAIARAWIESRAAQGKLADTWPDAPDFEQTESAATAADSVLFETIRRGVFGV